MGKIINITYKIVIFLMLLWGATAWFTWEWSKEFVGPVFTIIAVIYANRNKINLRITHLNFVIIFLFLFVVFYNMKIGAKSIFNTFCSFFPIYVLFCDKNKAYETLIFCAKWLAIILIPGILLHLYILINGPFLTFIIQHPNGYTSYVFFNYIFLLKGAAFYEADGLRFQSIFTEPGYCGTLLAFMIYALRYEMKKWYVAVIAIGLLLTMSLAGYVTLLVGYVSYLYSRGTRIRIFAIASIFLTVIYYASINYNNGNNMINALIIERLQPDKDKGISGNNRVSDLTEFYFDNIISNGKIFTGLGPDEVRRINGDDDTNENFHEKIQGAGYKIFLIYNGLFCAIMIFLAYYLIGPKQCNKSGRKYAKGFLIIVCITFIQAAYPTSYSWLIPYILGVITFKNFEKNENRYFDIS